MSDSVSPCAKLQVMAGISEDQKCKCANPQPESGCVLM